MSLSYYEWSLEVHKVKKRHERDNIQWENQAVFAREIMALIANVNRNPKKKPLPYNGSDFIKLSFDKKEADQKNKAMTPEQVEAKFGKYVKNGK